VTVGGQAPDEAGRGVGKLVNGVDRSLEVRDVRVFQWLLQPGHVELGEVIVHASPRPAPLCSSAQLWKCFQKLAQQPVGVPVTG
jgi:hypothetical protein